VHAIGFREPNCGESKIKESVWEKEILPEVRDEFLLPNGFRKCPNGNVDLVKALMAGRKILHGQLDRRAKLVFGRSSCRRYFLPFTGFAKVAVTEPAPWPAFADFSAALFFGFLISLFERT